MMRHVIATTLALATALFTAVGIASTDEQPRRTSIHALIQTTDNGCAGNGWANDAILRTLKVHRNENGSYRIREEDKGFFKTTAGGAVASPGNCPENKSKHGHTVRRGVVGTLAGYLTGTVSGGTFDPNGSCVNPCKQSAFIKAYFGPAATFSCQTNSRDCAFDWVYHARRNQHLRFRQWEERGTGAASFLKEHLKGDIASA